MDDLPSYVEKLRVNESPDVTSSCLDCLLKALENDVENTSATLKDQGVIPVLVEHLQHEANKEHLAKVAKIIAEMAKNDKLRGPFVEGGAVPLLNKLLCDADSDVALQLCRALGNLCCDFDPARESVINSDGLEKLIGLITRYSSSDINEADQKVRLTALSYFVNLSYGNETVQEKAVSAGTISLLVKLAEKNLDNVMLCEKVIIILGNLSDVEKNKVAFVGTGTAHLLVEILKLVTDEDQLETLLETIASLGENDDMKVEFAKASLIDRLVDIAHKHVQSSNPSSSFDQEFDPSKVATDIIVLLLTGDNCMKYVFDEGNGKLFKIVMDDWLTSSNELFQVSAALALGNFARNDDHCIKLVEMNVIDPLLKLLHSQKNELDIKLGHAALSALRNLAIPKSNKSKLLKAGTLETICPLLESEMHPVQFKLLGTIRMLIDGQGETALQLGENKDFVSRVVELSGCEIHAGVAGEANRLLAALVKHSGSSNVMEAILQNGGIPKLVSMATSEHALMQNEALVALTLIASSNLANTVPAFTESKLLDVLITVLSGNDCANEVKCNVLTLVGFLAQSNSLKQEMIDLKLRETVAELTQSQNEALVNKSRSILQHFT